MSKHFNDIFHSNFQVDWNQIRGVVHEKLSSEIQDMLLREVTASEVGKAGP